MCLYGQFLTFLFLSLRNVVNTSELEDIEDEKRRKILASMRAGETVSKEDAAWYLAEYPEDFERYFHEFNSGIWWQMVQEKIGEEFAVGAIIMYSDVTTITKNLKVWAVYGKLEAHMCL